MNRTLHEADNAQRILKLTADTMLLVDRNGICIDIVKQAYYVRLLVLVYTIGEVCSYHISVQH